MCDHGTLDRSAESEMRHEPRKPGEPDVTLTFRVTRRHIGGTNRVSGIINRRCRARAVSSRCSRDPISVPDEKFNVIDSASIFDRTHGGGGERGNEGGTREPKESARRCRPITKSRRFFRKFIRSERKQLRHDLSRDLSRKRGLYYLSPAAGATRYFRRASSRCAIRSSGRPKALNYV